MIIKGKGAPTIKTVGAVGDIYVDEKNGNRYMCTFAYSSGSDSEYEWKPDKIIAYDVQVIPSEKVVAVFGDAEPEKVKVTEDVVKTIDKSELTIPELKPKPHYNNQPQQKRKYTNYRKENYNGKN